MKIRKTLKVLATSALLFGTIGLATVSMTSCDNDEKKTSEVTSLDSLIIKQNGKAVSSDFTVTSTYLGLDLTWTSSNEAVAKVVVTTDSDGNKINTIKLTRTGITKSTEVTLTATSGTLTKKFSITVLAIDVEEIADEFEFGYSKAVLSSSSYNLDTKFTYSGKEASISWAINEQSVATVDNTTGKLKVNVTADDGKVDLVLTATFTYNGETAIRKYTLSAEYSNLGDPLVTVTPSNFATVAGLTLSNCEENTKYPVEFNINAGGYLTGYVTGGVTEIHVKLYGTYDNMVMYAGTDAKGTKVEAEKTAIDGGTLYVYKFATGVKSFYFENGSTHTVNMYSMEVYGEGALVSNVSNVQSITPANFSSTLPGVTMTNVVENSKFKDSEFTISKSTGSILFTNENGISMIVAKIYGTYDNMKLYVGSDTTGTLVSAVGSTYNESDKSTTYTYVLPSGTKSAYFANTSNYAVQAMNIDVYTGATTNTDGAKLSATVAELAELFKEAYAEETTITLPAKGTANEDVTITYAIKSGSSVSIENGKLVIKPTSTSEEVELTVTYTIGSSTLTKTVTFVSSTSADVEKPTVIDTIAELITKDVEKQYTITAEVSAITNSTTGNLILKDSTGTILIYGSSDSKGNEFGSMATIPAVGDTVTITGKLVKFYENYQLKDCVITNVVVNPNKETVIVEYSIDKALPDGLSYVPSTSKPEFYSTGLKLNKLNLGVETATFTAQSKVKVSLVIGALNGNQKSNGGGHAFTVYGINASGEVVSTKYIDSLTLGSDNSVILEGSGIVSVKVVMTDWYSDGTKCYNIALSGVKVTVAE